VDTPSLDNLLDQLEDIGGLEMIGPEGLTLLLALWRKSMKLSWARTFVMTNTEAIYKSGLKNRDTLNKYRNKLVQCGFIHYKPPARGKSDGLYTLEFDLIKAFRNKKVVIEPVKIPDNFNDNSEVEKVVKNPDNFTDNHGVVEEVVKIPDNSTDRFDDNFSSNFAYNSTDNSADNLKVVKEVVKNLDNSTDNSDDNSTDNTEVVEEVVKIPDNFADTIDRKIDRQIDCLLDKRARERKNSFPDTWESIQFMFREVFGVNMSSSHYEMARSYLEDGVQPELILYAIEEAKQYNAKHPKYVWKTLDSWVINGIKTITDYRQFMQFQVRKGRNTAYARDQGDSRTDETEASGDKISYGYYDQFPGLIKTVSDV
jgi:DnaD/phage-associated family protein